MNKLVLNANGNNYFRMFPDKEIEYPTDEKEQIEFFKEVYDKLRKSNNAIELFNNQKKGFKICVWELEDTYYLIQSLSNESGTYTIDFYYSTNPNCKNDYVSIAKMISENIIKIGKNYKQQIKDGKKYFENGEIPDEDRRELVQDINNQPLS